MKGEDLNQFHIPMSLNLAIVRNPKKADIVLSAAANASERGVILEIPKDPDRTHPNRQKEVLEKVNRKMIGQIEINQYDGLVIRRLYDVDRRPEWFYQSKIKGHCPQYSDAYAEWLIKKVQQNKDFFKKSREKYQRQKNRN